MIDRYGAGIMYNQAYPTTDGSIPWNLFWLWHGQLGRLSARDRVQHTTSASLAIGLGFGSEVAEELANEDIRRAKL